MNKRLYSIILIFTSLAHNAPGLWSQTPLLERQMEHRSWFNNPASTVLAPSVMSIWRQNTTYSTAGASWVQETSAAREGRFDATSHMWLDSTSVVTGAASYANGFYYPETKAECADFDMVYPYTLGDEIGGRMRLENYAFAGSYASRRNHRLAWGVSLSYNAELSFRHRDPRPRNVSGTLDIEASLAWRLRDYRLTADAAWRKYKQTSEITFVSEQGVPIVYHFTGLGTSYKRFNGVGYNTHYKGSRYSVALGIFPDKGEGFWGTVGGKYFSYDYILKDLNRLPMSELTDKSINAEIGWRKGRQTDGIAVSASWQGHKRQGTENLFGDASTNIYPQIGSLQMYSAGMSTSRIDFVWEKPLPHKLFLSAEITGSYRHFADSYLNPVRSSSLDRFAVDIKARLATLVVTNWYFAVQPFVNVDRCLDSDLSGLADDTSVPALDCIATYNNNIRDLTTYGAALRADRTLSRKIALGLGLSAAHNSLGNYFNATISFAF